MLLALPSLCFKPWAFTTTTKLLLGALVTLPVTWPRLTSAVTAVTVSARGYLDQGLVGVVKHLSSALTNVLANLRHHALHVFFLGGRVSSVTPAPASSVPGPWTWTALDFGNTSRPMKKSLFRRRRMGVSGLRSGLGIGLGLRVRVGVGLRVGVRVRVTLGNSTSILEYWTSALALGAHDAGAWVQGCLSVCLATFWKVRDGVEDTLGVSVRVRVRVRVGVGVDA